MGSTRLVTEVKSINPSFTNNFKKMSQSVKLRVPKLIGSKWVYEYPVSKAASQPNNEPEPNQLADWASEHAEEIPIETEKPVEKPVKEDWRGPWPHDNLGPKPRLVGGKLVKPKFIDY